MVTVLALLVQEMAGNKRLKIITQNGLEGVSRILSLILCNNIIVLKRSVLSNTESNQVV